MLEKFKTKLVENPIIIFGGAATSEAEAIIIDAVGGS
jgi:hypothetical protein